VIGRVCSAGGLTPAWFGERVVELGSGVPVEFDQRIDVRWLIGGEEYSVMGGCRQEGGQRYGVAWN
jgi:hypothetical protein